MHIATLQSIPLSTQPDFYRDFCQAPSQLRAKSPWQGTGQPASLVKAQIEQPWPTPRQLFLAYGSDGSVLASCAAAIAMSDSQLGFVGFFEAIDSSKGHNAALQMLAAAHAWLRSQGANRAIGPVNLCTWFPYRFQAESEFYEPRSWEPSSPPHYRELWQKSGYTLGANYFSEQSRLDASACALNAHRLARAEALGYRFRPLLREAQAFVDSEVPLLHELTLLAFADNFLFEPLPLSLFRQIYLPLVDKLSAARFSWFVYTDDNKPCGFLFAFAEQDSLVIKTVGIVPEHRGHALQMALLQKAIEQAITEDIGSVTSALLKDGIASEKIPALFATSGSRLWRHRYVLLVRTL